MTKYIIRLDDACEKMDIANWDRVEMLLDCYSVKPLVGVIPFCEDIKMNDYIKDDLFWDKVKKWEKKGWVIAMHGYNHVYSTEFGGINPVNEKSEFAGMPLDVQREKIRKANKIFSDHNVTVPVFFAPSHTFDGNTILALKEESGIRIVSDTVAFCPYSYNGITFVPQQSGKVRKLPFGIVTFCYHPNTMKDNDFIVLEKFLKENSSNFIKFPIFEVERKRCIIEKIIQQLYYVKQQIR